MAKFGKTVICGGAYPEKHELETSWFLNSYGKDIEFLAPVRSKGIRTPDITMDGVFWEIKCPIGHGRRTLDRLLKNAMRQSKNIIFDLRRTSISDAQCLSKLKKEFKRRTNIKRFLVITKRQEMVDMKK
ncbi:MAG: hypothetical protein LBO62_06205 [Endomicrobium sp.]|jgi:hypothetical protein|nr:hypothetical protein [Endomicrobium sp.]